MSEIRYIISDASKRLEVEPHVLRYWEEELEIEVPRNELGHRYYREEDMLMLENIKMLKDQGFQLKAIKMLLPNMNKFDDIHNKKGNAGEDKEVRAVLAYEGEKQSTSTKIVTNSHENYPVHNHVNISDPNNEKVRQFQSMMKEMIESVLKQNNATLGEVVSDAVTDSVIKEMDYLLRLKDEREEERFKKFDEALRDIQKARQEVAVTTGKKKKKLGLF